MRAPSMRRQLTSISVDWGGRVFDKGEGAKFDDSIVIGKKLP
jgi:hypothetical protein